MTALARVSAIVVFVLACPVMHFYPIAHAKNSVMKSVLEIEFVDATESVNAPKVILGMIALKQVSYDILLDLNP
jgi:hypothetical protein